MMIIRGINVWWYCDVGKVYVWYSRRVSSCSVQSVVVFFLEVMFKTVLRRHGCMTKSFGKSKLLDSEGRLMHAPLPLWCIRYDVLPIPFCFYPLLSISISLSLQHKN